MTDLDKIRERVDIKSSNLEPLMGAQLENARLAPIIDSLLKIIEEQRAALLKFKAIGDMGPEDTVMCFFEDWSNILYAADALASTDAKLKEIGEGV